MRRLFSLKALRRLVIFGFVGLAAAGLAGPGIAAVLASSTNVPSPGAPNPINILPSTIKGSMPVVGGSPSQQYLAVQLYRMARNPAFWQAANAVNAGTATPSQITLVQQTNGTWSQPATRLGSVAKTVGGVTTVIGGFTGGVALGAGLVDAARSVGLIGFDPDGATCGAVGVELAGFLGADCTGFLDIPEGFTPNTDAAASGTYAPICNAAGTWCVQLIAAVGYTWKPSAAWHTGRRMCFDRTVGSGAPPAEMQALSRGTGAAPSGNIGDAGTAKANTWVNIANSTFGIVAPFTGAQYAPNPVACPAGTDYSWSWSWTTNGSGVTLGLPDLPAAFRLGSTGTPSLPATADPVRQLQCIIVASGQTFSALSATFRETDGVLPEPVCPNVPAGLTLQSTEIRELNTEDGTWLTLWSSTTTPEFQAANTLAPECSNGTCMLDLRNQGVSCFQSPGSCLGWFTDPNKTSKYSCHYGTHAVDLAECTVYAPTFQPEATSTGNTYGDPASGGAVANPTPTAGSDPDGSGQACWPSGWAVFNPLEWVYRPIVCAAEWAFVPRTQVVTSVAQRVTTAWDDTLPAQAPAIVSGWAAALPEDVGGCQGPAIDLGPAVENFGVDGVEPQYPLSACEAPWSGLAAISKAVTTMLVMIGGAFAIVRYISATIGFTGFGRDQGAAS